MLGIIVIVEWAGLWEREMCVGTDTKKKETIQRETRRRASRLHALIP